MKTKISKNFLNVGLSPIVEISELAAKLAPQYEKKTGQKFVFFQRGEMGLQTPNYVRQELGKLVANQEKFSQHTKYPKSSGNPWAKKAVLKHIDEIGIKDVSIDNIILTYGGQEGLELVFKLFSGSKVASFSPIWSCMLENILPYANVKKNNLRLIPLEEKEGKLKIDFNKLEKVLNEVNILYLNTPQNPTGKVFSLDELDKINKLCKKNDVYIVSDEAYKDILFDDKKHVSMLEFEGDHIFSIFTASKSYAMTGVRVGYTINRNKKVIELLKRGNYTQTAGVSPIQQFMLKTALCKVEQRDAWLKFLVEEMQQRRDAIYPAITKYFADDIYKPEGAFYYFVNLNKFLKDVDESQKDNFLKNKLLNNGVAIVPGTAFGTKPGYARLSYSTMDAKTALEGVERIAETLENLK